ncbi:hypothetical protein ERX46_13660 [Brumimicrobium glaciale]|uniref:DUF695 domain-containing protein n=1 Tax=Brumimicrobium glaciale TaxID=200475 RepID=A0A4Q4KGU9_9FLAO|nr:hypothetical protein [Brumimicrobium glaciale]RYM32325.1 hypothetical protein ERX46_13660 [Brumimicrobium glaciale]
MSFSLFNKQSKEEKFWNWFSKSQQTFYHEIENLDVREEIFNDLSNELSKVHQNLVFEFSPIHENGIREFTISAEGVKELFPFVENLVDKAPEIMNWKFNAFRQRIPGDDLQIKFGDFNIGYSDIYFRYQDGKYGEIGIELNIRGFDESAQTQNAIYILLDGLMGEYDITMGLDWIEWVKLDESNIENLNPITSLRGLIDEKKK